MRLSLDDLKLGAGTQPRGVSSDRITRNDKRQAVLLMLQDKEFRRWPQGRIAESCGASREFVNRVYREIKTGNDLLLPESEIERRLTSYLIAKGRHPRRQVRSVAGIADIVTEDSVYEVKEVLDRTSLFQAIGQVLLYRQAIDVSLSPVIAGKPGQIQELLPYCKSIGISVLFITARGEPWEA